MEVEIELMSAEDAEEKPVGLGRSEPNQFPTLSKPKYGSTHIHTYVYVFFYVYLLKRKITTLIIKFSCSSL